MERFWKIAPWLTRLILLPPTFVFALIASRYLTHPVQTGATIGLAFNSPLAITTTTSCTTTSSAEGRDTIGAGPGARIKTCVFDPFKNKVRRHKQKDLRTGFTTSFSAQSLPFSFVFAAPPKLLKD